MSFFEPGAAFENPSTLNIDSREESSPDSQDRPRESSEDRMLARIDVWMSLRSMNSPQTESSLRTAVRIVYDEMFGAPPEMEESNKMRAKVVANASMVVNAKFSLKQKEGKPLDKREVLELMQDAISEAVTRLDEKEGKKQLEKKSGETQPPEDDSDLPPVLAKAA